MEINTGAFKGWMTVSNLNANDLSIPKEAFACAPKELENPSSELLPRERFRSACRICGEQNDLTKEHLPPKSAGNSDASISYDIEDWFNRDKDGRFLSGKHQQGGIWGRTLCSKCNNLTGSRYGTEYAEWVAIAERMICDQLPSREEQDANTTPRSVTFIIKRCKPGAFIRQVLSIMVSLSSDWDVSSRFPEIRDLLLHKSIASLPGPLRISMCLMQGLDARLCGPTLVFKPATQYWKWVTSFAFFPFAFEMILCSSDGYIDDGLCRIDNFLTMEPESVSDVEIECRTAFAHTPYPTDWRSQGEINQAIQSD